MSSGVVAGDIAKGERIVLDEWIRMVTLIMLFRTAERSQPPLSLQVDLN